MTYEEIVLKAREEFKKGNAAAIKEHLAVQFNIIGEGHGIFYLEVSRGTTDVQPYEYYDRDAIVVTEAKTLFSVLAGETALMEAFTSGMVQVEGNLDRVKELENLIVKKEQDKVEPKKPVEKPETVKLEKEEKVMADKAKEEKQPAKKTEEEKQPAKKAEEEKQPVKKPVTRKKARGAKRMAAKKATK